MYWTSLLGSPYDAMMGLRDLGQGRNLASFPSRTEMSITRSARPAAPRAAGGRSV
jgi:hypothetical protein